MTNFILNLFIPSDATIHWSIYLQGSASPQMEALVELHDNIMFYLVIIFIGVAWILLSVIRNYVNKKFPISNKYLNHGTLIELIWTITPALILILIAFPCYKLLYLMDEVTDSFIVPIEIHESYWSYQYPDFLIDDDEELELDILLNDDSSSSSTGQQESDNVESQGGEDSVNVGEGDIPDADGSMAECTHNFSPAPMDLPQDTLCDTNPSRDEQHPNILIHHSAWSQGLSPTTCSRCHIVICRDCHNDYVSSDEE